MAQQTGALQLLSCERTLRAIELRKAGATYMAIGTSLGVSPQAAHKRVAKVLRLLHDEAREETEVLRTLEAARLDSLQLACWKSALQGNLQAVDRVLRIMERRSKLLGLDTEPFSSDPAPITLEETLFQVRSLLAGHEVIDAIPEVLEDIDDPDDGFDLLPNRLPVPEHTSEKD